MSVIASLAICLGALAPTPQPTPLSGTQWYLTTLNGRTLPMNGGARRLNIEFDSGTGVFGFSGVNTFRGQYSATAAGVFSAPNLATTMMAGDEGAMRLETEYLRALGSATRFRRAGNELALSANGDEILKYVRADAAVITTPVGVEWRAVSVSNNAFPTIPGGEAAYLLMGADMRLTGFTGVNRIIGSYRIDGPKVQFHPATTMRAAVNPRDAKLEHLMLQALEAADTWVLEGKQLVLFAGNRPLIRFSR